MPRWDDEMFAFVKPDEDIICKTCTHRLADMLVKGKLFVRYTYGMCDVYDTKPMDVIVGKKMCPDYEKEEK